MKPVNLLTPAPGLLIQRGFLDATTCGDIRAAMDRGASEAAEVAGETIALRETIRRATNVDVEPQLLHAVEHRLDAARALIERTIRQPLGGREGTGFLRYPPGGFYRPHRDRGKVAGWPAAARRVVTVVIFLNSALAAPDGPGFSGGQLLVYPAARTLEISPETGMLVAFRAEFLHEVRVVNGGFRDTAVDWFYDPPAHEP